MLLSIHTFHVPQLILAPAAPKQTAAGIDRTRAPHFGRQDSPTAPQGQVNAKLLSSVRALLPCGRAGAGGSR